MKIDVDHLNQTELIELNHRILERLRHMERTKTNQKMMEFKIGDRVTFHPEGHPKVVGMLTRFNIKTVTVITDEGEHWNVAPRFVRKVSDTEGGKNRNSNVIRMNPKNG